LSLLAEEAEAWGVRVFTANGAEAAIKVLRSEEITAVLSDVSMPGGSGLEILRACRSGGSSTPFIFFTAFGSKNFMRIALQLGAVDFLEKPFEMAELKGVILKALEIGARQEKISQVVPETKKAEVELDEKYIHLLRVSLPKDKAE
jgi:DNA-binding NtrC family response regulator